MRQVLRRVSQRPTCRQSRAQAARSSSRSSMTAGRPQQLQLLWDFANATLGGTHPPSAQQLDELRTALALVPLSELGLLDPCLSPPSPPLPPLQASSRPITYLHIYEDANFSMGIFCLPGGAQIPLHNHPSMTVFSRVLYGSMHVRSFDWRHPHTDSPQVVPVYNHTFTPKDRPAALFPTSGGNIHQFTALTDCAVLDLLWPPYSPDDHRDCTYYREVTGAGGALELEEYEPPTEFVISSAQYQGIQVGAAHHLTSLPGTTDDGSSGNSIESGSSPRSVTPTHDQSSDKGSEAAAAGEIASKFNTEKKDSLIGRERGDAR